VFATRYSYHHGHFDGIEREFRGFGRVEQFDTERYDPFAVAPDKVLYQPPVKTVTWFHTGAVIDRERVLSAYAHEYFPAWLQARHPDVPDLTGGYEEYPLPEPDFTSADLDAEEWRE